MAGDDENQGLLSLTTEIVASFVGNNPVAIGDLPAVIAAVFGTLRSLTQGEAEKPAEAPMPARGAQSEIQRAISKVVLTPNSGAQRTMSAVRPISCPRWW